MLIGFKFVCICKPREKYTWKLMQCHFKKLDTMKSGKIFIGKKNVIYISFVFLYKARIPVFVWINMISIQVMEGNLLKDIFYMWFWITLLRLAN